MQNQKKKMEKDQMPDSGPPPSASPSLPFFSLCAMALAPCRASGRRSPRPPGGQMDHLDAHLLHLSLSLPRLGAQGPNPNPRGRLLSATAPRIADVLLRAELAWGVPWVRLVSLSLPVQGARAGEPWSWRTARTPRTPWTPPSRPPPSVTASSYVEHAFSSASPGYVFFVYIIYAKA